MAANCAPTARNVRAIAGYMYPVRRSGESNSYTMRGLRASSGRSMSGNRSEEHTSELQSLAYLVCRLLLEKKKNTVKIISLSDRISPRSHRASSLAELVHRPPD